ncbi:unnamed protein product, partial [Linum tenue]
MEGGLGLKDLTSWNVACIARLVWLLLIQGGSFWVAWVSRYRLRGSSVWEVKRTAARSWT